MWQRSGGNNINKGEKYTEKGNIIAHLSFTYHVRSGPLSFSQFFYWSGIEIDVL